MQFILYNLNFFTLPEITMSNTFTTFPQHFFSCKVVADSNFASSYAQGPNGNAIGATLTASAAGTTTIDGYVLQTNDYVLIAGQSLNPQNGPYVVTQAGTASLPTILTRRDDFNAYGQYTSGYELPIALGTTFGGSIWVLQSPKPVNIGVDPAVFLSPGTGGGLYLQISNNLDDVANAGTARTNLGLGTAATKAASASGDATVASVSGATVLNNVLIAADTAGTVKDSGTPIGVYAATVTLTAAQVNAMYATPFQLVAPVAGKVILPVQISANYIGGSAAFTAGGILVAQYANTAHGAGATATAAASIAGAGFLTGGTTNEYLTVGGVNNSATGTGTPTSGVIDTGVFLSNQTQAFATGTGGSLVVTTYYTLMAMS
jgi:hypothetical protein